MYQIQNIVFDIEDTERDLARWAWGSECRVRFRGKHNMNIRKFEFLL